jgi:predicted XRE-type DNA-binding protein
MNISSKSKQPLQGRTYFFLVAKQLMQACLVRFFEIPRPFDSDLMLEDIEKVISD